MNRIRWLILILGPAPILGTSWTVSGWFHSEPAQVPPLNEVQNDSSGAAPAQLTFADGSPHPEANDDPLERTCRQSARRLDREMAADGHVLVRPPFVLGGDLSAEELGTWHDRLIAPAVRAMRQSYFRARPHQPITVLLLRSEASYNRYSQNLFGHADMSPYGYYKPNSRTLIVNVATGDGSLLHELTHALMDFDFPAAPAWLNEGLASLHEQSRFHEEVDGSWIEGLVNWRLDGLQNAIRDGRLRPLAALLEERNFRGPLEGTNYAQARYLCLFLQRKGLLREFYREFREQHTRDPRGVATLAAMFPQTPWVEVEAEFQHWALALEE